MTGFPNLIIEPLHAGHDRVGFCCGVDALDRYLKKQAGQDIKRRISRVFVATTANRPSEVLGYYTLSTLSIDVSSLPKKFSHNLPKHPIPAALVGRLAIRQAAQKQGIGKLMLADAVKRTLSVSDQIAIYALVVDAISERAEEFYRQFGFNRLTDDGPRLFLPLKTIMP